MTIDVARARAETPGVTHVAHFNNAGAALPPRPVTEAVIDHLRLEERIGGYEAAEEAHDRIEAVYGAVARLIGCAPDEIALVENATVAWDMAFYAQTFRPGDRILTAVSEYASNFMPYLQVSRRTGAKIEVVPNDADGRLSVEALKDMIDERVKLISVTHVPTNGGLVNPAEAIGKVARDAGIPFLLDACQSVGQMPIDVEAIGCDMLSATGRKYLRGPRGTGFLYVRRGLIERLDPPFIDLHSAEWIAPDRYRLRDDARRFENWESNHAARLGLGAAVDYALGWGLEAIEDRIAILSRQLRAGLEDIPGVTIRDLGVRRCGIITFTLAGHSPQAVRQALRARSMNLSVSQAMSTLLDMSARNLDAVVRASVHYYNTEDEVDRLIRAVRSLA